MNTNNTIDCLRQSNRINGLDTLRAFAAIMIIIGHSIRNITDISFIGTGIGYVFVSIFIILSSTVLGLNSSNQKLKISFLQKRLLRIIVIYYPYLLFTIPYIYFYSDHFNFKNIVSHFTFINYFIHSELFGEKFAHLWYMSIIVFLYIMIYFYDIFLHTWMYKRKIILLFAIFLSAICDYLNIRGCRLAVFSSFFLIFYYNYSYIESFFRDRSKIFYKLYVFTILIFSFCTIYSFKIGVTDFVRDWLSGFTSVLYIPFFKLFFTKNNRIIRYLSTISFELYLVHTLFTSGKYSLWYYYENENIWNHFILIIITLLGSIILAIILQYMSNFISIMGKK